MAALGIPGSPAAASLNLSLSQPGSCGVEVPQGQVVLAVGLGRAPAASSSRVRQKRVPPFPRLEAGYYLSHPRWPGRKQESCLSQAWHSLRNTFELCFSLSCMAQSVASVTPESSLGRAVTPESSLGRGGLILAGWELEASGKGSSWNEVQSG